MTTKQHQIIEAALKLFSEEGYNATATSKVAKIAGVSEGLIFRHFKNKKGLLAHLLKDIEQQLNLLFSDILEAEEPKEIIRKTLELPFNIKDSELELWKLHFKLIWELDSNTCNTFSPIREPLIKAFEKLRYRNPKLETEFLIQHLEGLIGSIIKNEVSNKEETNQFLLKKYHL